MHYKEMKTMVLSRLIGLNIHTTHLFVVVFQTAHTSLLVLHRQTLCLILHRNAYKHTNNTIPNATLPQTFQ